jgi:ketopantoate reductase
MASCSKQDQPAENPEKDLEPIAAAQRKCGSMEVLQQQLQKDPSLGARMQAIETHTQQLIRSGSLSRLLPDGSIQIPVVVNVLYRTTAQNISLAQIQSQIDILERDYNALNSEFGSVPALFSGVKANVRPDAMRLKYRKLLLNLGNALEALCGRLGDDATAALDVLRAEGTAALDAAGVDYASAAEDGARRGDTLRVNVPRGGGSTWQSLRRGTGRVEADHLNGEIVLLGRLHGVPTPANDLVRRLVNAAARAGHPPGELTPTSFLRLLGEERHQVARQ